MRRSLGRPTLGRTWTQVPAGTSAATIGPARRSTRRPAVRYARADGRLPADPGRRRLLSAEILSIGTELTSGETRDTNAGELARVADRHGRRGRPADGRARSPRAVVEDAFRAALGRVDLVVSTGGLGPTPDDLTRESIAADLGRDADRRSRPSRRGCAACGTRRGMPFAGDQPQAGLADPVGPGPGQPERDGPGLVGRSTRRPGGRRAARPAARDAPDVARRGAAPAPRARSGRGPGASGPCA